MKKQCGNRNVEDTTSLILRTLMTNDCAELHKGYKGRNINKFQFKNLILHRTIIGIDLIFYIYIYIFLLNMEFKNIFFFL